MRNQLVFLFSALMLQVPAHCQAAEESTAKKNAVQFTQIQDLNPNAGSTNQPIKQKWAVCIGISKFKDGRLNNDLSNDRAAREFYKYLIDPNAGRFATDHVRLMTNEAASQQLIVNTLGQPWLGTVAGKDDLVVVFIATNGFPTTDGNTYLCSYNCALDNIYSTCISMQSLMQQLRNNIKSDRLVLVLQSCYSGSAQLTDGAKSLLKSYNVDPEKLMLGKGFVILSSSKPDQQTFGDTFSNNLIAALREQDGMVPLNEAFAKARQATEYDTTHRQIPPKLQTPVLKSEWKGNDLILGAPPIEKVSNIPDGVTAFLGAEAHYMKGSQLAGAGNLDGAIAEYKLAIAADSQYADAVADYGAALALQGNWKEAAEQLKQAVALHPHDVLYRTNLARVLDQLGDSAECIKQLEFAYSVNPKDSVVLKALASKALASGDTTAAQRMLNEAIVLYPKSAVLYDKLAYAESVDGNLNDALNHARTAVQLDPKHPSAKLNLGAILVAKGNLPEAITTFRSLVTDNPKNADGWYLLSQAMQKAGDTAGERDALSKFVSVCVTSDKRADECRKRLSELSTSQTAH